MSTQVAVTSQPMRRESVHETVRLCGAKTRAGGTCRQPALPSGRCRYHGGKSPSGIASATFQHGRASKYLPTRLVANYEAALADTDLLAARDAVAVLDARIMELFGRIDAGESGRVWRELGETWDALEAARVAKDTPLMQTHMAALGRLIKQGLGDWAIWDELYRVHEHKGKQQDRERKRLVEMQQMVTSEQVLLFVGALADSVRRHVTDRDALVAIQADITRLTGGGQ